MKYVKCIYKSGGVYLTIGKIYEVKRVLTTGTGKDEINYVEIINDRTHPISFPMVSGNIVWFVDMTVELRDNKINEILGWN